jgi:hypothetical protein
MPPNVDFGTPVVFFDSHPEEQESYLYSYWSSFKSTMRTAWTGDVPKFHNPGTLRVIWYTNGGSRGFKDYDLHEYATVRDSFDVLLALPEVRRVVIMGYSGQNPYILGKRQGNGKESERADKLESEMDRIKEEGRRARLEQRKMEGRDWKDRYQAADSNKEGRTGKLVDINAVIEKSDKVEEQRRKEQEDKTWKENDGLLSGEMV